MGVLIDSTVIVRLERRDESPSILEALYDEPVAISAVTAAELFLGIYHADSLERRLRREAYLEGTFARFIILPVDLEVARVHARIRAGLSAVGQAIGAHDSLIAATALSHGFDLVTDNVREFNRIPGLKVRQPAW